MKKPPEKDPVRTALELLAQEVRRRVARHAQVHQLAAGDSIDLRLQLPTHPDGFWIEDAIEQTSTSMNDAIQQVLVHYSVVQPGKVYCLRCAAAACEHSQPTTSSQVFAGYGPSGLPRFLDLSQWMLERSEPRVDQLYHKPAGLIAHVTPGCDLAKDLLPAFRDRDTGYQIWGQVAAGWFRFPRPAGVLDMVALTFQVVSSRPVEGRRRFGLNLIGCGPGGEPIENLFDVVGELPWAGATRWAHGALQQIERSRYARSTQDDERLTKRIQGLLGGLARRLERRHRARDRRTGHAQKRHRQPERPTWKAMDDLSKSGPDDLLFDTLRETLIVLGERGRAHVFTPAGKLVTSIRYSPESIERRRNSGRWRPATEEQATGLRNCVALGREGSPD